MIKVKNTSEMTNLVLSWTVRNFQFCNEYENLKEAAFKNMNEWNVDTSLDSDDKDVQSFYYILERVKNCEHLFDFLDLKMEVENESNKRVN